MNIELLGQEPQDDEALAESKAFFDGDGDLYFHMFQGSSLIQVVKAETLYQHFKARLLAEMKETP